MTKNCKRINLQKNINLFEEGDSVSDIYLIRKGEILVIKFNY